MRLSGARNFNTLSQRTGCGHGIRVSRRMCFGHLRRQFTATGRSDTSSPRTSRRRTRGGRLRARHGKDGRMYRHVRPGSNQPCDGNCDGVHGFRSPCGDHGKRDGCKLGQGQLSGSGHCRHHHARDKAQLHCQGHRQACLHHPRGVLHCLLWQERPRADRYSQKHSDRAMRIYAPFCRSATFQKR